MESADSEQPRDHFAEWMRERGIAAQALAWVDHYSFRSSCRLPATWAARSGVREEARSP